MVYRNYVTVTPTATLPLVFVRYSLLFRRPPRTQRPPPRPPFLESLFQFARTTSTHVTFPPPPRRASNEPLFLFSTLESSKKNTMGALNLIPLFILFAVVAGLGWVGYQVRRPPAPSSLLFLFYRMNRKSPHVERCDREQCEQCEPVSHSERSEPMSLRPRLLCHHKIRVNSS